MKKRWLSVLLLLPLAFLFLRATPVQAVSYPAKPQVIPITPTSWICWSRRRKR